MTEPRILVSDWPSDCAFDSGTVQDAIGWNDKVVLCFLGEYWLLLYMVESSANLCSYTVLPPKGTYCCGQVVLEGGRMP